MIGRRQFLATLGALYAAPGWTQASGLGAKTVRVAILSPTSPARYQVQEKAFVEAMRELGWIEGRNIVFDRAYAEDDDSRAPALAAELIRRAPSVIWSTADPTVAALARGTRTIPIVFGAANEPIERGLVKSLAQPDGNVTGVKNIGWELAGKRLQLLKQVMPKVKRVAVLADPRRAATELEIDLLKRAGDSLGVSIAALMLTAISRLEAAMAEIESPGPQALLTTHAALFLHARKRIIEFANERRMPVIGHRTQMADDGALLAYSSVLTDQIRRSAHIVDKVLRGASPAGIPVEQPTKFELVVNLKTAKALGITVPDQVLVQADRILK